jgi:hypothetical protein
MPIKGLNDLADFSAEKVRGLIILLARIFHDRPGGGFICVNIRGWDALRGYDVAQKR